MKAKMAVVKNIINLRNAYAALTERGTGVEGMGLVHGDAGYGKSTAMTWLRAQVNAVNVRAMSTWTQRAMLASIMRELGAEPHYRAAENVQQIVRLLIDQNRGLFVDELDYLVGRGELLPALDTLRDIHDLSKMPVLLVGMKGVHLKVANRLQLARRITQSIEFLPADLSDARVLCDTVCEIQIDDELLGDLHVQAKGNIGLMTNGLARIEAFGKVNSPKGGRPLGREQWGNRQFFLGQAR
jgi:hypothetical protein